MDQLESNIINSFRKVKNDIMTLQSEIIELKESEQRLTEMVAKLQAKPKIKTLEKTVYKQSTAKKHFVASKEGKKFHDVHCPFAHNIKPKSKLTFKSKNTALNKGYKPCTCVTK